MRMLAIDERPAESCFAGLEKLGVHALADGGGLKADHRAKSERAFAEAMFSHAHEPVRGEEFVRASRTRLLHVADEALAVQHEVPAAYGVREHGRRRRFGI